jgi:hypothetical protein
MVCLAEDYYANDYPDEDEFDSEYGSDGDEEHYYRRHHGYGWDPSGMYYMYHLYHL